MLTETTTVPTGLTGGYSTTFPALNGVCPRCGRCRTCGQPNTYPAPYTQPIWGGTGVVPLTVGINSASNT